MTKPPKSPPSSDIDGVDEDAVRNTDAAIAAGQTTEDLARAREQAAGKPEYSNELDSRDDRSS